MRFDFYSYFQSAMACFGVWMLITGFRGSDSADAALLVGGAILIAGCSISSSIDSLKTKTDGTKSKDSDDDRPSA